MFILLKDYETLRILKDIILIGYEMLEYSNL